MIWYMKKLSFGRNFGWQPKFVKGFRFLLDRNWNGKNWFQFLLKGEGILAERKISAENFGFSCSLDFEGENTPPPLRNRVKYLLESKNLFNKSWLERPNT